MLNMIFIGNLTADPAVRTVQGDKTVCSFTVAVNRKTKGEDAPSYINVTTWEKRAEVCAKYLTKGKKVCVSVDFNAGGNINVHAYTKKDGAVGATLEVTASSVEFLSSGNQQQVQQSGEYTVIETTEDLPF